MTRTHLHWAEKLTVQFAAAAGLAVVYFLAGPVLRGADPQLGTAFLVTGRYAEAAVFAVMVLVLSAACALLTLPSRPEGALLAALIAAGGISARSPQFRTLLWRQNDGLGGLYAGLIAEVVVLTAVLLAAYAVVSLVRWAMAGAWSGIVWKPPQPAQGGPPGGRQQRRDDKKPDHPAKSLGGMGLALAMGMALVLVFLQSGDRGQVIFALVAGLALAVMAADRLCPVSHSGYFLLVPMVAAVLFYLLGWVSSAGASAGDWTAVPLYARVLPIDWLTAGCGGAALGYWISQRATESRQFE